VGTVAWLVVVLVLIFLVVLIGIFVQRRRRAGYARVPLSLGLCGTFALQMGCEPYSEEIRAHGGRRHEGI
jgi:hypothetical protein